MCVWKSSDVDQQRGRYNDKKTRWGDCWWKARITPLWIICAQLTWFTGEGQVRHGLMSIRCCNRNHLLKLMSDITNTSQLPGLQKLTKLADCQHSEDHQSYRSTNTIQYTNQTKSAGAKILRHFRCFRSLTCRGGSWDLVRLLVFWNHLCARMYVWIRVGGWDHLPASEDNYALMDVHVNCRKVTSETMKGAGRSDFNGR